MNKIVIAVLLVFLGTGPVQAEKGDVWYEISPAAEDGAPGFDVEVFLDARDSTLAAYQFKLTYDPSDGIAVDTSKGRYRGVSVGPDGFIIVANAKKPGKVYVNGFDMMGVPGKERMHLMTVYFTGYADNAGSVQVKMEKMADLDGKPIK